MVNIYQIFTWWHKQPLGTFFKTFFTGKLVGCDELGNKYYTNKNDERWVIYADIIDASKITSDWYLWMHYTVNEIPVKNNKKYLWEKKHLENRTGTKDSYKPNKISKFSIKKKYESWNE